MPETHSERNDRKAKERLERVTKAKDLKDGCIYRGEVVGTIRTTCGSVRPVLRRCLHEVVSIKNCSCILTKPHKTCKSILLEDGTKNVIEGSLEEYVAICDQCEHREKPAPVPLPPVIAEVKTTPVAPVAKEQSSTSRKDIEHCLLDNGPSKMTIQEIKKLSNALRAMFGRASQPPTLPPPKTDQGSDMKYKLLRRIFVGENFHRSGWPYAMLSLGMRADLQDTLQGILIDDFVEQTFLYHGNKVSVPGYREPWVGFFHHPPNAPDWFWENQKLQHLWTKQPFLDSLPYMKMAFCLSNYLGDWLKKKLDVPVCVLKHPCEDGPVKWGEIEMPKRPRLLSFGWYLRDTRILSRIPDGDYDKLRLWAGRSNHIKYDRLVEENYGAGDYKMGKTCSYVPNAEFDKLLATSVVVSKMLDVSAANGVIDCIARNTPILVNKHPAVVEYLGADYPLYYEDASAIPGLLEKVDAASVYISKMKKGWMDGSRFADDVHAAINRHIS